MVWKIKRGDEEFSAPDLATLKAGVAENRILPTDYVLNPVLERWFYAREIPELEGSFAAQKLPAATHRAAVPEPPLNYVICKSCGFYGPGREIDGVQVTCAIILLLFLILPGVAYLFYLGWWKASCPQCNNRGVIPANSPNGLQELARIQPTLTRVAPAPVRAPDTLEEWKHSAAEQQGESTSPLPWILGVFALLLVVVGVTSVIFRAKPETMAAHPLASTQAPTPTPALTSLQEVEAAMGQAPDSGAHPGTVAEPTAPIPWRPNDPVAQARRADVSHFAPPSERRQDPEPTARPVEAAAPTPGYTLVLKDGFRMNLAGPPKVSGKVALVVWNGMTSSVKVDQIDDAATRAANPSR